jgi:geranylgeranyl reductase family protein
VSTDHTSDVIVVGAGPAGATAARALALGGARVSLLERQQFPRNKPCGGGITTRALRRFPWLAPALERITTHTVSRLLLEGPSGRHVVLTSPEPAVLLIRRLEFDHLLATLAVEAGAGLVEDAWVSQVSADDDGVRVVTRGGRAFSARFLVAADGVNGIVTRRLGLHAGWHPSRIVLDMMEETPAERLRSTDPATLWVSYGYRGADGYGYIFPKRGYANVGIGSLQSYYRDRVDLAPYDLQQQFVGDLLRRGLLEGTSSRADFTPYHVPVGGPIPHTARGRVLVAGDAGGFVNAYTAEGIYYAMVTGELAGRAIIDAGPPSGSPRSSSTAARQYVRAWRTEIGTELRDSVLIQKYLFRNAARIDGVVARTDGYREVADTLIAYVIGTVPYLDARRTLLSRFPRVILRLARIALFG